MRGIVINPPNLPCWRGFPLAAEVERAFAVPARVDNDANAAGLAEVLWGAGNGYTNVFYATFSAPASALASSSTVKFTMAAPAAPPKVAT